MSEPDPGSFRDPLSQVHIDGDEILRGLTPAGLAEYEAVAAHPFYGQLVDDGLIVGTEVLAPGSHPLHETYAAVLRHQRVEFISYPYEWTFEMLRDAALAHLEVTRRAVAAGFSTKDASAYNIAFANGRPVFIDIGSFERPPRNEPWPGYRQFCEMFLNPLVICAKTGVAYHPWLRGSVGGITAADTAALIPTHRRLRHGLGAHVTLQARGQRTADDSDTTRRATGFSPTLVTAQLDNLEKTIRSLTWSAQRSVWSDYSDRTHYTGDDLPAKKSFITETIHDTGARSVVDLGANDGLFSTVALEAGATHVIAADFDHLVVDRLYRHVKDIDEPRIHPLVLDLTNPSPGTGWRSRERLPFTQRTQPDLTMCLAVVHHLAITNTIPLTEIIAFLAELGSPLIVEFPHPEDPKVQLLLSRKRPGLFDHYNRTTFEAALADRYTIERTHTLDTRTLYRATPKPA